MTRPRKHLCIATGQNLANLIPALQSSASNVVILETPAMREAAGNLRRALESHDISVTRLAFDDSNPDAIRKSAVQVALDLGVEPLVFNVTGGHKLMTLALADSLGSLADDLHIVYTDTRNDQLAWLTPEPAVDAMDNLLAVDDILRTQGYRRVNNTSNEAQWQALATERAELTRHMGDKAESLANFFGVLNRLADMALSEEPDPFSLQQQLDYTPGGRQAELLKIAQRLDLLDWEDDTLVFSSFETAQYFRGGWLEEYVWLKLKGIQPRDFTINAEVVPYGSETRNEIDALVAHRNRLMVIECKTSGFGKFHTRDVGYIYKLSQIGNNIGGIMCEKLLLSARPVHEDIRVRASEYKVKVLAAAEVKDLVDHIRKWMSG